MEIRLATSADYKRIATALRNKGIDYITPAHARTDIDKAQLYVLTEGDVLIAQCALVYEPAHQYHAIKRLVVSNRRHCGRGVAQQFLTFFCAMDLPALGCTPWVDNLRMQHLLRKNGFEYQYTFLHNYQFYKKTA
jgi:RimJ/RimL family protein N-acetyltransferase